MDSAEAIKVHSYLLGPLRKSAKEEARLLNLLIPSRGLAVWREAVDLEGRYRGRTPKLFHQEGDVHL